MLPAGGSSSAPPLSPPLLWLRQCGTARMFSALLTLAVLYGMVSTPIVYVTESSRLGHGAGAALSRASMPYSTFILLHS